MWTISSGQSSIDNINQKTETWVLKNVQAELKSLRIAVNGKNEFYSKNWNTVTYHMDAVKQYLQWLQWRPYAGTNIQWNSTPWIMAVQIALESLWNTDYDVGVIDGILWKNTKNGVVNFQKANGLKPDWLPGPKTIEKILNKLGGSTWGGWGVHSGVDDAKPSWNKNNPWRSGWAWGEDPASEVDNPSKGSSNPATWDKTGVKAGETGWGQWESTHEAPNGEKSDVEKYNEFKKMSLNDFINSWVLINDGWEFKTVNGQIYFENDKFTGPEGETLGEESTNEWVITTGGKKYTLKQWGNKQTFNIINEVIAIKPNNRSRTSWSSHYMTINGTKLFSYNDMTRKGLRYRNEGTKFSFGQYLDDTLEWEGVRFYTNWSTFRWEFKNNKEENWVFTIDNIQYTVKRNKYSELEIITSSKNSGKQIIDWEIVDSDRSMMAQLKKGTEITVEEGNDNNGDYIEINGKRIYNKVSMLTDNPEFGYEVDYDNNYFIIGYFTWNGEQEIIKKLKIIERPTKGDSIPYKLKVE